MSDHERGTADFEDAPTVTAERPAAHALAGMAAQAEIERLRATLAEHVEENLRLHARVNELEKQDAKRQPAAPTRCTCGDAFVAVTGAHAVECPVVQPRAKKTVGAVLDAEAKLAAANALLDELRSVAASVNDVHTDHLDVAAIGAFDRMRELLAAPKDRLTQAVRCTACQKRQCDGTHVGCPSYLLDETAAPAPTTAETELAALRERVARVRRGLGS